MIVDITHKSVKQNNLSQQKVSLKETLLWDTSHRLNLDFPRIETDSRYNEKFKGVTEPKFFVRGTVLMPAEGWESALLIKLNDRTYSLNLSEQDIIQVNASETTEIVIPEDGFYILSGDKKFTWGCEYSDSEFQVEYKVTLEDAFKQAAVGKFGGYVDIKEGCFCFDYRGTIPEIEDEATGVVMKPRMAFGTGPNNAPAILVLPYGQILIGDGQIDVGGGSFSNYWEYITACGVNYVTIDDITRKIRNAAHAAGIQVE